MAGESIKISSFDDPASPHLLVALLQLEACKEMWSSALRLSTNASSYQKEIFSIVVSVLAGNKEGHARSEVPTDDGLFSMDILVDHPQWGKVAIEVDGPFHFFTNHTDMFHGKAKLRNRWVIIE